MIDDAKMMGLSDFGILVYILVPCSIRSVISGTILSMTRGLGEYGATAMLAGNIAGKTRTLPLAVYSAVALCGGHTGCGVHSCVYYELLWRKGGFGKAVEGR